MSDENFKILLWLIECIYGLVILVFSIKLLKLLLEKMF